jgi:hypothetical protein
VPSTGDPLEADLAGIGTRITIGAQRPFAWSRAFLPAQMSFRNLSSETSATVHSSRAAPPRPLLPKTGLGPPGWVRETRKVVAKSAWTRGDPSEGVACAVRCRCRQYRLHASAAKRKPKRQCARSASTMPAIGEVGGHFNIPHELTAVANIERYADARPSNPGCARRTKSPAKQHQFQGLILHSLLPFCD